MDDQIKQGTLAANREQALAWVNARRAEWFLPPIETLEPGYPNSTGMCVLARSLGNEQEDQEGNCVFFNDGIWFNPLTKQSELLPEEVATFEHDFERGHYPDLTIGKPSIYFRCNQSQRFRPTAADAPALTG